MHALDICLGCVVNNLGMSRGALVMFRVCFSDVSGMFCVCVGRCFGCCSHICVYFSPINLLEILPDDELLEMFIVFIFDSLTYFDIYYSPACWMCSLSLRLRTRIFLFVV